MTKDPIRATMGGSLRNILDDENELSTTQTSSLSSSLTSLDISSPQSPYHQARRKSIRQSISSVLISPVRAARGSLASPSSITRGVRETLQKTGESARHLLSPRNEQPRTWRKELDLPPKTTREEALAVLMCRELECMDL